MYEKRGELIMEARFYGVESQFASISNDEEVDISTTDHTVAINNGIAMCVVCDTDGEILKIDTPKQAGITRTFFKGYNPRAVTKVYKVGSSIAGNVWLGAW